MQKSKQYLLHFVALASHVLTEFNINSRKKSFPPLFCSKKKSFRLIARIIVIAISASSVDAAHDIHIEYSLRSHILLHFTLLQYISLFLEIFTE